MTETVLPKTQTTSPTTPLVGVFRRGGLHFGHHAAPNHDLTAPNRDLTTPNRDLTATKRGELRCVRGARLSSPHVEGATKRGNCTNRGATRRRHADRMLLMVQNPHHYPGVMLPMG